VTCTRQILFIQGGGAGAHDEWDDKLVERLRRGLGGEYEVRYPRMPDEGDPSYARWSTAIRREMTGLDDGAVVAGHSVGAAILINTLAEQPLGKELGGSSAEQRPERSGRGNPYQQTKTRLPTGPSWSLT
jgi:predicted alpha/beta hydrolase family esterase